VARKGLRAFRPDEARCQIEGKKVKTNVLFVGSRARMRICGSKMDQYNHQRGKFIQRESMRQNGEIRGRKTKKILK